MASDTGFLFSSIIFVVFMLWVQAGLGVAIVSGDVNTTIAIPNCNATDTITCTIIWGSFFFSLSSLYSGFFIINAFLTALIFADIYIFLKLIRGGG